MYEVRTFPQRTVPETTSPFVLMSTVNEPVLLLHMDGADGSTVFTDATGRHNPVPNGGASISTAQSVFGGASGLFNNNQYLSLDGTNDFVFGTGDFTIDFRIRMISNNQENIIDFSGEETGFPDMVIYVAPSVPDPGPVHFYYGGEQIGGTTFLIMNTWFHVALTRSANRTKLFINGIQEGITYIDNNDYSVGRNGPWISASPTVQLSGCYVDEVRMIKGAAAWTSNFVPPTSPYTP